MAIFLLLLLQSSGCMFETRSIDPADLGLEGSAGASGAGPEADGGVGGAGGLDGVGGSGSVIVEQPECTPGTEKTDCPGTSCDPATMRCSTFKLASRGACWTCVSDTDCDAPNHRCVEMNHEGDRFPDDKRGFCLQVADVELELDNGVYELDDDNDVGDCASPFQNILIMRPSLSGGPTDSYCGINEASTTCFALRAFQNQEECPGGRDDECPAGGLCRTFKHNGKAVNCCTYECTADLQCPWIEGVPNQCTGYCGG